MTIPAPHELAPILAGAMSAAAAFRSIEPYTNRRVELDQSKEFSVREFEQLTRYIVKPHFWLEAIR